MEHSEQATQEKLKIMRTVRIEATFPQLRGGICNQIGKGKASTVRVAAARAVANLLKQPQLRRKQFTQFTALVSIGRIEE